VFIDIFLLGDAPRENILPRSGAHVGDKILVTGALGDAAAGIALLLNTALATTESYAVIARARRDTPTPRMREGQLIGAAHAATAMIDISDGLASDLGHICERSNVGVRVLAEKLPVAEANRALARNAHGNEWHLALFGGEDYELLFTAPATQADALAAQITRETDTRVSIIGELLPASEGRQLVLPDARVVPLEARGWIISRSDMKRALTIAGSDSGGGAGIQADLKTFAARGVFGMSVLTALTAQNTIGVQGVFEIPPDFVARQIDSVASDIDVDAVKTGMLSSAPIIVAIAAKIREHRLTPLVVDPVMVAKGGDPLLHDDARDALIQQLLPLATVVTPNLHEARALCGFEIATLEEMRRAAQTIHQMGPRNVVVKGGHLPAESDAIDLLYDGKNVPRISRATLANQERFMARAAHSRQPLRQNWQRGSL